MGREELKLRQIVSACRTNEKYREFIYKKFYGYLMGVAIRYISDKYEAEELVNDAFLKAFRNIARFTFREDNEDSDHFAFRSWLARITVTTALDRLRVRKKSLYVEDVASTVDLMAVDFSTNLDVQDILKLMERLPEIQSLIFNLYEIEGFSHEEISDHLNIPSGTSRAYLTRAKNKLRELYNETLTSDVQSAKS